MLNSLDPKTEDYCYRVLCRHCKYKFNAKMLVGILKRKREFEDMELAKSYDTVMRPFQQLPDN